jgi:hypothetical protein
VHASVSPSNVVSGSEARCLFLFAVGESNKGHSHMIIAR